PAALHPRGGATSPLLFRMGTRGPGPAGPGNHHTDARRLRADRQRGTSPPAAGRRSRLLSGDGPAARQLSRPGCLLRGPRAAGGRARSVKNSELVSSDGKFLMVTHRFAEAAERGDRAGMSSLFAEDVTYHTPTLTADLHGKELTLRYR